MESSEVWLKVFSEVQTVMLTSMQRPSSITWLVAPGLAMIALTYGLARFAYGLFLPEMRDSLDLSESVLGLIGAGSYGLGAGARDTGRWQQQWTRLTAHGRGGRYVHPRRVAGQGECHDQLRHE